MTIQIELPDFKAISRNKTNGKYWDYNECLKEAEKAMEIYGRKHQYHFSRPIDVTILAYYDDRSHKKAADSPNIDDKILTDTLNRYKMSRQYGRLERNVYFIEDDNPTYLRYVKKRAIPSDHYKVIMILEEVEDDDTVTQTVTQTVA